MIEHEIDENSGDRNVHPNRPSDARDLPMSFKVATQPTTNRGPRQGHNRDRQNHVCQQHDPIDPQHHTLRAQRCVNATHQDLVQHIGHQENTGAYESAHHAAPMRFAKSLSNANQATDEKNASGGIQRRVQGREIRDRHNAVLCYSFRSR